MATQVCADKLDTTETEARVGADRNSFHVKNSIENLSCCETNNVQESSCNAGILHEARLARFAAKRVGRLIADRLFSFSHPATPRGVRSRAKQVSSYIDLTHHLVVTFESSIRTLSALSSPNATNSTLTATTNALLNALLNASYSSMGGCMTR